MFYVLLRFNERLSLKYTREGSTAIGVEEVF